jgi:hypothetical protein
MVFIVVGCPAWGNAQDFRRLIAPDPGEVAQLDQVCLEGIALSEPGEPGAECRDRCPRAGLGMIFGGQPGKTGKKGS